MQVMGVIEMAATATTQQATTMQTTDAAATRE
jgi:hypothetical protein